MYKIISSYKKKLNDFPLFSVVSCKLEQNEEYLNNIRMLGIFFSCYLSKSYLTKWVQISGIHFFQETSPYLWIGAELAWKHIWGPLGAVVNQSIGHYLLTGLTGKERFREKYKEASAAIVIPQMTVIGRSSCYGWDGSMDQGVCQQVVLLDCGSRA